MKPFKISLEAARVNAGMSQREAAEALEVSSKTVHNWETGKVEISLPALVRLSELYHVSIDNILIPGE